MGAGRKEGRSRARNSTGKRGKIFHEGGTPGREDRTGCIRRDGVDEGVGENKGIFKKKDELEIEVETKGWKIAHRSGSAQESEKGWLG